MILREFFIEISQTDLETSSFSFLFLPKICATCICYISNDLLLHLHNRYIIMIKIAFLALAIVLLQAAPSKDKMTNIPVHLHSPRDTQPTTARLSTQAISTSKTHQEHSTTSLLNPPTELATKIPSPFGSTEDQAALLSWVPHPPFRIPAGDWTLLPRRRYRLQGRRQPNGEQILMA